MKKRLIDSEFLFSILYLVSLCHFIGDKNAFKDSVYNDPFLWGFFILADVIIMVFSFYEIKSRKKRTAKQTGVAVFKLICTFLFFVMAISYLII